MAVRTLEAQLEPAKSKRLAQRATSPPAMLGRQDTSQQRRSAWLRLLRASVDMPAIAARDAISRVNSGASTYSAPSPRKRNTFPTSLRLAVVEADAVRPCTDRPHPSSVRARLPLG